MPSRPSVSCAAPLRGSSSFFAVILGLTPLGNILRPVSGLCLNVLRCSDSLRASVSPWWVFPEVATLSRDCCELKMRFYPRLTRVVASCELFAEKQGCFEVICFMCRPVAGLFRFVCGYPRAYAVGLTYCAQSRGCVSMYYAVAILSVPSCLCGAFYPEALPLLLSQPRKGFELPEMPLRDFAGFFFFAVIELFQFG